MEVRFHASHLAKLGIPACIPQVGIDCFRCWFARILRAMFDRLLTRFNQHAFLFWTARVQKNWVKMINDLMKEKRAEIKERMQIWLARDHDDIQPQDF
jgi:hypothetical protein